jgi:ATP-dependent protease ClpP protease subunit
MRRGVFAALFMFVALNPALADVRIEASNGGPVTDYLQLFDVLRKSGQRIVIDGPCYSACTLVLSTIPTDRICVTRRAVLAFHAPRRMDQHGQEHPAPEAITRAMTATYPAPIRDWINWHGGLTGKPLFLRGRQLAALYPRCR